MFNHPQTRRTISVFVTGIGILIMVITAMRQSFDDTARHTAFETPRLSTQRQVHILYGDETGGGHLYGAAKPCKSEFPADWSAAEVIETVKSLAANDNMQWTVGDNGYFSGEKTVDGIRVRVVLDRDRDDIVTAYPLNTRRNACPLR